MGSVVLVLICVFICIILVWVGLKFTTITVCKILLGRIGQISLSTVLTLIDVHCLCDFVYCWQKFFFLKIFIFLLVIIFVQPVSTVVWLLYLFITWSLIKSSLISVISYRFFFSTLIFCLILCTFYIIFQDYVCIDLKIFSFFTQTSS